MNKTKNELNEEEFNSLDNGGEFEEEFDEEEFEEESNENSVNALLSESQSYEEKLRGLNNLESYSNQSKDSNFLHVQISSEDLLKKLEHFYRGEYEGYNERGEKAWIKPENKEQATFNEFGVSSMMEITARYIDKNTTLSDYTEERIYEIIADIGDDLILFIQSNYKKMGMDTHFKKTKFRLIITTTCHMIESAYRRALHGQTLEKLNESRAIHQFETNEPKGLINPNSKRRGFMQKIFG